MSRSFARDAIVLFAALRAGDLLNLAAGMWFVPKYVSSETIGAVLPVSSFATFLSLPVFALAMTVMKETAVLSATGERGKAKSLLRGVFLIATIALFAALAAAALVMPEFLRVMRVEDAPAGFFVAISAFLGCMAPVWTDALQALRRFRTLAGIEIAGAAVRFAVMAAIMPVKALAGFFAGQAALPAFRIAAGAFALQNDLKVPAQPFWTRAAVKRMAAAFAAILVYQGTPMFVSMLELSILRDALPASDSAGYYMASRFSDLLHYLTLPMLLVTFPYTAAAAAQGDSTRPYVKKCALVTLAAAATMALVYRIFGGNLIALMPNGSNCAGYAAYMPILVISNAFTSCQVFHTNTEVSAGRFGFLAWFLPLHLLYAAALGVAHAAGRINSLDEAVAWFAAASAARFAFCLPLPPLFSKLMPRRLVIGDKA